MARRADSYLFRAHAVRLNWLDIARRQWKAAGQHAEFLDAESLRRHSMDVHVTWTCAKDLGLPFGPFTVWTRASRGKHLQQVAHEEFGTDDGLGLWWYGKEAATVAVTCTPIDPSLAVGLILFRTSPQLQDAVAATAVRPTVPGTVQLQLSTSGATMAVLTNATNAVVSIETLDDVVNDPAWEPIELVGLPVDQPWSGTAYDWSDQGPLSAPVSPYEAAVMRLQRGGPQIGWSPTTAAGHLAPPWSAPDPKLLVDEVRKDLLDEILPLYDGGADEAHQFDLQRKRAVDGPRQGTKRSSLATSLDSRPWSLLMLPAMSDPFLNLATGFGSTYAIEKIADGQIGVGNTDFLITAKYSSVPALREGAVEMAAYCPRPLPHGQVPTPTGLTATQGGMVAPVTANQPWRESIYVSWDRLPVTAALARLTQSALARYPSVAGSDAECLLPPRDAGGWRPLTITADGKKGEPGFDRATVADGGVEIPIGSGGRHVGYAVAVSDVFGVWSEWNDVAYDGDEPAPQPPRLVSLHLDTSYAGGPACPSTLRAEVAVEWVERTPTDVELVAMFFPIRPGDPVPPAGLDPSGPNPAGGFRRDVSIGFLGDQPIGIGCSVIPLNAAGDGAETPGPLQGDAGRRYAITAAVPTLDFGAANRWGVQVWVRRALAVGASPTIYVPGGSHPAVAIAASPMPVVPQPQPLPPGVPLGSTNDAEGRSHVRVKWTLPAGADVRTNVVWEVSESALRQHAGLSARAPESDSPGVRLAALWAAYDALDPTARRNLFRRVAEVAGTERVLDHALPKGSNDIHLFMVTTVTSTGVDSPWPQGPGLPHEHLQAVIAPRLRRPAPPLVRSTVASDGSVTLTMSSASKVPVTGFAVYRTRSESAARSVDTMGPPVMTVAVDAPGAGGRAIDPATGHPIHTATWTGSFPPHWDAWLVRVVAVPVDRVSVEGVLGLPSASSEVASVLVPPTVPPDLDVLTSDIWGSDHRGVLIRTSTSAPWRTGPLGAHRLIAVVGADEQVLTATPLEALAETALTTAPGAASTAVVGERGARAGGRSPLGVWFTRPVAADPVTVTLRLIDPLGRSTERTITVPGWVPPPPVVVDLRIIDMFRVIGRGVSVDLFCDATIDAEPPYVMEVTAYSSFRFPQFGSLPAFRGFPGFPRFPRPRPLSLTIALPDIPSIAGPVVPGGTIQVAHRRRRGRGRQGNYSIWVPLTGSVHVTISIVAPDGAQVTVAGDV